MAERETETERMRRVLHELSGAVWRLQTKGYLVKAELFDDECELERQNLLTLLEFSMLEARKIVTGQS